MRDIREVVLIVAILFFCAIGNRALTQWEYFVKNKVENDRSIARDTRRLADRFAHEKINP